MEATILWGLGFNHSGFCSVLLVVGREELRDNIFLYNPI